MFDLEIRETLIKYHAISMLFHIIAVIVIFVIVLIMNVPYIIILEKFFYITDTEAVPGYLKTSFCPTFINGTAKANAKEYVNAFEFINCVRRQGFDINVPRVIQSIHVGEIPLAPLIITMEIISILFHYAIAFIPKITGLYLIFLDLEISPFRYAEFSITNVFIIISLFALNEVNDVYLILYVAFTTSSISTVSWLGFELITSLQKIKSIDKERFALMTYFKYSILFYGYFYFIMSIVVLVESYELSIQSYFNLPNKTLWQQIYTLVLIVNVGIISLYSAFPVLHGIQNGYISNIYLQKRITYLKVEPLFIVNSTLAQGFLSLAIIISTIQRY